MLHTIFSPAGPAHDALETKLLPARPGLLLLALDSAEPETLVSALKRKGRL